MTTTTTTTKTYVLYDGYDGPVIDRVTSALKAKQVARDILGCERVSRWEEADGYCLYPTGSDDDTVAVVRVRYA
jgi:hypothetical protein